MATVGADLRHAVRSLRHAPWFSTLVIATLAIGIGGTTALFSLVDAVALKPLPYRDPDRLVEIWGQDETRTGMRVPGPILDALREHSHTLAAIAIHGPTGGILRQPSGAVDVRGDRVSANYLDVMGVPPLAGRGFGPADEAPGASAVMLVSFQFWQRHLGGSADAVGRTLYLDATPFLVVGIMPPEFRTSFRAIPKDFWTPFVDDRVRQIETTGGYELIARLAPGVTRDAAAQEVSAIAASVRVPEWSERGRRLGLVSLLREVIGDSAGPLQLVLAAVGVVLIIACANIAQLLLARSDRRAIEFATRKALGAGDWSLFRLALVESLVLSAAGGAAGLVLAYWLVPVTRALAPSEIPRLADAAVDGRVLVVAVALTLLTGCLCGLSPALGLARRSLVEAMRPSRDLPPGRSRFRSALLVLQVASAVALCALAGLLVRTLLTLVPSNPGFEPRGRTVFSLVLLPSVFPDPAEQASLIATLTERVRAIPGVTSLALASNIPFSGEEFGSPIRAGGGPVRPDEPPTALADVRSVSPDFFPVMRMTLQRGRGFAAGDTLGAPRVAIVNQQLARRLVPGGEVLGQTVRVGRTARECVIVGVVADARSVGANTEVLNEIYLPFTQAPNAFVYLIVQSDMSSRDLNGPIRQAIRDVAPRLPLRDDAAAASMEDLLRLSVAGPRFSATLFGAFSAVALLLSAIGVFGLVAYTVAARRHELAIRTALGARPRDLMVAVTRSAVTLTAVGIVAGLQAGAWLTRLVASQLYAVTPLDRPTFALAALVMLAVSALAAFLPARRAARVDPMTVIRQN